MARNTAARVSIFLLAIVVIHQQGCEARALLDCTAVSIGYSGSVTKDARSAGKAVVRAFSEVDGCDSAESVAKAKVKVIARALSTAIARTSGEVRGGGCTEAAYARAQAGAEAVARAFAEAIADATASATNNNTEAMSRVDAKAVERTIKRAAVESSVEVTGVGKEVNAAVGVAAAEAIVTSIAEAISVVECDDFESAGIDDDDDPCACSPDGLVNGVETGRPGCDQHLVDSGDEGFFCMVVGGSDCSSAQESGAFSGVYWRAC